MGYKCKSELCPDPLLLAVSVGGWRDPAVAAPAILGIPPASDLSGHTRVAALHIALQAVVGGWPVHLLTVQPPPPPPAQASARIPHMPAPSHQSLSRSYPVLTVLPFTHLTPQPPIDTFIQKTKKLYMDTRTQRNLSKLNDDLAEVHSIMTRNIQEVLGQGEKLDSEYGITERGGVRWGSESAVW